MASRIKGITVEIGGDTTGLDKELRGVNSTIKTTQSSLKDVNKLLKLDPSNTNLVTQKQKLLKDAIGATKEKLENGRTSVSLQTVDMRHPFYDLEGSNNIVLLNTERYMEYPMLIQGYGAGASVTAAGVFAKIISIANI